MTSTIYLIRHGETDWNVERRMQGHGGVGLNEMGRQQARQAADNLDGRPYAALYSSDLDRALETAYIIGQKVNLDPAPDPRLRERGAGIWEGMLLAEISQRDPEGWRRTRADRTDSAPNGGETFRQVADRMQAAMHDIAARHPQQSVLAVSHGLAIGLLRAVLAGEGLERGVELRPANAEITRFEWPPPAILG